MSRPQEKLSRGESVEVAQKDGESASGEALPEGWAESPLGEAVEVIMGQSPPSSTYREEPEGLPFYQGKAEFGDFHPTPRKWCVEPKKVAVNDDILLSIRAPVGPTNLASEECAIGRGLAILRSGEDIATRYIFYTMRHLADELENLATGSTFRAVSGKVVNAFPIRVPPKAEQSRIVSAIESLQERSSRARVLLSEVGPLIGQLRQSVLRDAFSGKLTSDWRAERERQGASRRSDDANSSSAAHEPAASAV